MRKFKTRYNDYGLLTQVEALNFLEIYDTFEKIKEKTIGRKVKLKNLFDKSLTFQRMLCLEKHGPFSERVVTVLKIDPSGPFFVAAEFDDSWYPFAWEWII